MITVIAIDLLVVLVVSILWTGAMDREDARQRAGLPVVGRDELVPRAVAIPAAWRRRR